MPRLDPRHLVNVDFGLRGVLDVDVHDGRVERRLLVGQRQRVHGVRGRLGPVLAGVFCTGGAGSGRKGGREVAELSG